MTKKQQFCFQTSFDSKEALRFALWHPDSHFSVQSMSFDSLLAILQLRIGILKQHEIRAAVPGTAPLHFHAHKLSGTVGTNVRGEVVVCGRLDTA